MKGTAFFLLSLNEIKRPNAPEIHSHGPKSANFRQTVDIRLCLFECIVGAGFRVGGSPQALRLPHWPFEARRRAQHPSGNNQRTADLAGKAANSRVLRTVSLFPGSIGRGVVQRATTPRRWRALSCDSSHYWRPPRVTAPISQDRRKVGEPLLE
jgi:hypothetical protein